MIKDKTGKVLPPEAFENSGEVRDPKEVDSHYSPEYLARRKRWVNNLKAKLGNKT